MIHAFFNYIFCVIGYGLNKESLQDLPLTIQKKQNILHYSPKIVVI